MKLFNLQNLLFTTLLLVSIGASAQTEPTPPMSSQPVIEPIKLSGPRVGFTYIAPGALADRLKKELNVDPFVTQFGWQFETQYFSLPDGTAGLVEGVLLVGGLEQEVILPSASLLVGIRSSKGLEFGFGPNISLSGPSFVFAVGGTLRSGYLNFPINLVLAPSRDGFRWTLLFGFNARTK